MTKSLKLYSRYNLVKIRARYYLQANLKSQHSNQNSYRHNMCTVWRVLLEQDPPHRTHSLRLGSPDHNPAAKLGAGNQKL
jgi:hypothetical protein